MLFYAYNCKIKANKHNSNARVIPVLQIEGIASILQYQNTEINFWTASHLKVQDNPVSLDEVWTAKNDNSSNISEDVATTLTTEDNLLIADEIQHLLDNSVAKKVIDDAVTLHEVLNKLNKSINDRSVDAFNFLFQGMSIRL